MEETVYRLRRAEVKHEEGRHVGLDFYDLLIEAHYRGISSVCYFPEPFSMDVRGASYGPLSGLKFVLR